MDYVFYLLETALRDEIIAETDATNYFLGGHAYSDTVGSQATSKAFRESQRMAQERIPQLQKAIEILIEENKENEID